MPYVGIGALFQNALFLLMILNQERFFWKYAILKVINQIQHVTEPSNRMKIVTASTISF
ncbi:MAG: hypothetical protein JETCAE01_35140 [Anaerolineaceae bacterium]|nr:MAG: hypothetical protein JETCAE01_35140 [Anaerolineaceae bacterium]